MSLVLVLALVVSGIAEAKPGKGRGGGGGRGKVKVEKSARVDVFDDGVRARSSSRFSSSFPPGYAWGLRRNRGEPVPLGSPMRGRGFPVSPVDGQQIFRAGRTWEFDAADNRWVILP